MQVADGGGPGYLIGNPGPRVKFRFGDIFRTVLKVSAIVPVYNPGANIDDCIDSLLGQSLPAGEYEVIFVDDGSTDETPARLDALAAEHPNVRVEHIPNSGWPGRPRNVGMDMARGQYVYFADNDDWLAPDALERVHAVAEEQRADIVVGKVVGHGKYVPRPLFASTRHGLTIEWQPLLGLLTPHKLFRRAMLEEHAIRFPEGRRRLEDHIFTVHAYFHAQGISVLADRACYHWVLRKGDDNASYRPFDPGPYYENVREVLDLVEEHTEPGPLRDRLLSHWYRGKMLGRVGGGYFARRDPAYRQELYREVRRLALERYGPAVEEYLAPHLRVRSRLLLAGSYEALEALAALEEGLRADVRAATPRDEGGAFVLPFEARLAGDTRPLRFEQDGDRIVWVPPPGVPDQALTVAGEGRVQLILRSTADSSEYLVPTEAELRFEAAGEGVEAVLAGDARIAPGDLPEQAGVWEVLAGVNVAGFSAVGRVRAAAGAAPVRVSTDASGRVTGSVSSPGASMAGRLARRMPRLARAVRRARTP
jgi:glycosyltransferase involved in cell wall biosynthesis